MRRALRLRRASGRRRPRGPLRVGEARGLRARDLGDRRARPGRTHAGLPGGRERRTTDQQVEPPASVHGRRAQERRERAVGRVVPAAVEANVDDDAPHGLPSHETLDLAEDRGRRRPHRVEADVHGLPLRERRRPQRSCRPGEVERARRRRQHRRVVPEHRVSEGARIPGPGHRREAHIGSLPVGAFEREHRRLVSVDDVQAVEDLGRQRVHRREAAKVGVVVARNERLDELEDAVDRHAADRHDATTAECAVLGVDHDDAV